MGNHVWIVVGQARDASAQLDAARALGSSGHKHFRGTNSLPASTVVFADIGLIETQHVEPLDDLQVTFQGQGRVFTRPVEGSHEDAKLHSRWYGHSTFSFRANDNCQPSIIFGAMWYFLSLYPNWRGVMPNKAAARVCTPPLRRRASRRRSRSMSATDLGRVEAVDSGKSTRGGGVGIWILMGRGTSSGATISRRAMTTMRSIQFSNSRTFPGQS